MDRTSLVVVALPAKGDYVRKISSEDEPHLTLLYLGENNLDASQLELMTLQIQFASSMLAPFHLEVESRGELGPKNADVLFFNKKWSKEIARFRDNLLRSDLVMAAYQSADQFPEWTPHLTMGYPENPAKKDPLDHREITYVSFDRIALWIGESEGPTFKLKYPDYDMEVAMSQVARGRSAMDGTLTHYGVKGMRWGVRRDDTSGSAARPSRSEDARDFEKNAQKIQTHGTQALTNKELQSVINRMNMENQYHNLSASNRDLLDNGHQQVKKILAYGETIEKARKFLDTPTGKAVKTGMKAAAAAGFGYATGGAGPAAAAGAGVVVRRMTR